MKLSLEGLKEAEGWVKAGIFLPPYDVEEVQKRTVSAPKWVHFGIGNIFRIFIGGIADTLITEGLSDTGIICAEAFDYDIVDKIYTPYDNLALCVTLHRDGRMDKKVIGSLAEAVRAKADETKSWDRLKKIFTDPGLQMVSFTITEKGYGLTKMDGAYLGYVQSDMEKGPGSPVGIMAIVTSMLLERYRAGAVPLTLVSMDNCSHNGDLLKSSVMTTAGEWKERGYVDEGFLAYLADPGKVAFPWSMIDKITPRPGDFVEEALTQEGVEQMDILVTGKSTYIAPFINAEGPQYLVIEDTFPNGRPPLEKAGVYMTDRETVNKAERMKVTACLNPIHTALASYGRLLKYEYFADLMDDPQLKRLAWEVGYAEGLPKVTDPKIFSPKAFLDEVLTERMPNKYLGDTTARICTDSSQGVGVRFGETIKAYVRDDGSAGKLKAIPLAIAGWLRYFYGIDDDGQEFELSPDPLAEELKKIVSQVPLGSPEQLTDQLRPVLSNVNIFGIDLYEAGVGEKIEGFFKEEIAGKGAVRTTLEKYL